MLRNSETHYSDEYKNRAWQDWYLVIFFIVLSYIISYTIGVYEWTLAWLNFFEARWLNELLVSFIFSIVPFAVFSWRRFQDLKLEIVRREEVQENYKNYRNQIHKVFESLSDIVFQTDNNLSIVWANSAALDIYEHAIGAPVQKLLFPDEEFVSDDNYFLKAIENGTIEKEIKYYPDFLDKKNDRFFEHIAVPYKDTTGEIIAVTSISRDITERMQVEEAKSRLASIIESSNDAIFVVSLDGSIHSWNKAAEEIFDYTASQVVGQQITILDHIIDFETLIKIPDDKDQKTIGGRIQHVDLVPVRKKNSTIYVSLTVYPFVGETGNVLGFSTIARDITSSIKSEEALRESENRFRQLADTIQDAFWLIDWETQSYLFTSPAFKKIWGQQPKDNKFDLTHWAKAIHPNDRQRVIDATYNIIENNGMMEEFRVVDQDGSIRWVRDRAFPVYNTKGIAYRVAGIAQDITAAKLAEQALRESETRFKELFQNMSNGVAVYEALDGGNDFIVKDFNKAAEFIEKTTKKDIIGKKITQIMKNEKNHTIIKELQKVLLTNEPKSYLFTLYEGEEIIGWRQNYIYKLPSGEVVSIFDDVTEKRKQDRALRESEERYRTFVTNFKGIAFRWSPNYEPIFMHGLVEEITGYRIEDFMGKNIAWNGIIHPDDLKAALRMKELVRSNANLSNEFEYRIITKNNKIEWVNENLLNVSDDAGNIIYIQSTIYYVTQRKFAEEELLNSRQQLRNLALHLDSVREEERKQIAFEIHDELGYALTAVKLDLAWLVKKIDISRDNLEVRTKEMSDLIELTIQKVRTISSQLRPSILDHFGLVAAIEWQSKEFQRRTSVRTRVVINPKDLVVPESLATPIFRIFQESLTNISRYAKATRVDVLLEQQLNQIFLRVADNGIGIDPERIKHKDSFGLLGMREKAKSMGGEVIITNIGIGITSELDNEDEPNGGTEVLLSVPFNN